MSLTQPAAFGNCLRERIPGVCRRNASLAIAVCLIRLAACAGEPSLVPAPDAERVSPAGTIARDADAGVTVTVDPDAWRGKADIESAVTPMHVQIENRSGHKIRIRYEDFSSRGPIATPRCRLTTSGPASPSEARRTATRRSAHSPIHTTASTFRRSITTSIPGLDVWHGHPFPLDPYYDRYYPYWRRMRIELPTAGMLRHALPEGVLEDGGTVAGFLYFERIEPEAEETRVALEFNVVDIVSDKTLTTLEVPFVVRRAG